MDLSAAGWGDIIVPEAFSERTQAIVGRLQFFPKLGEPAGMGEISRPNDRDALELRPRPKSLRRHVPARCSGISRVDVQVSDEGHGKNYSIIEQKEERQSKLPEEHRREVPSPGINDHPIRSLPPADREA